MIFAFLTETSQIAATTTMAFVVFIRTIVAVAPQQAFAESQTLSSVAAIHLAPAGLIPLQQSAMHPCTSSHQHPC
jgi:hypothetical protein